MKDTRPCVELEAEERKEPARVCTSTDAHTCTNTRACVYTSMHSREHTLTRAHAHTAFVSRSHCGLAAHSYSHPRAFHHGPAMPFAANEELCCPICEVIYSTANSSFVLSCAKEGCQGHLCFDCLQKAVFPGNRSSQDGTTCPHCRRTVDSYSYAFFAAHKNVSALQDKLTASDADAKRLTKSLATAKAQADEATHRLQDWCAWATATKSAIQAMPSSAIPPHVRAFAGPQLDSDTARSRSPRSSVRTSGAMYSEYNG